MKRITDSIFYIGADDLTLDLFESQYILEEGMAYLQEALGGTAPSYLVVHHMEPDHSAGRKESDIPALEKLAESVLA